jgi:hypothetical protein
MKKTEDLRERSGQAISSEKPGDSGSSITPTSLRRLKWDELVAHGDFIEDKLRGLELWEGPTGFRADAFVMPIYRRDKTSPSAPKKSKTTGSRQSVAKIERGN